MALAVVSYPSLSCDDFNWIQDIRKRHDTLYFDVIDPHIPFVFPTELLTHTALTEHVRGVVQSVVPFKVVFRCAVVGDPDFQGRAHVFLMPDEGLSDIVHLHDQLYTGPLRTELRLDLPFMPHIGIANAPAVEDCKSLVDALNNDKIEINAQVEELEVISLVDMKVTRLERIGLGSD